MEHFDLQKERLIAFVAHDLNNAANALDLNAQLLLRSEDLPEHARLRVARIREAVRNMQRLSRNLLDIGESDEHRLAPSLAPVDVGALVGEVLMDLEAQATHRRVALTSDIGALRGHADVELLRRVLENLVENAIRHSPTGSTVRVASRTTGRTLEIRVVDEGSGVPRDMRDRVFDRFVQLGNEPATRGVRGLGLPFCKLAVEAHGGRIWIEDASPGAMFCFMLPSEESS